MCLIDFMYKSMVLVPGAPAGAFVSWKMMYFFENVTSIFKIYSRAANIFGIFANFDLG